MHENIRKFCIRVKEKHPNYFSRCKVLDCGSLDINGNNRYLFTDSEYVGVDLIKGKNVDIVSRIHELDLPDATFKTVVSTEMLEHDRFANLSCRKMLDLLSPGGLLIVTCASLYREPHGIESNKPEDSPATTDFYREISTVQLLLWLNADQSFKCYELTHDKYAGDIYFWGIGIG